MKIYNDDCFNIFPKLEKQSIDMIIVDLPYGQTICGWDVKIDLDKMWESLKRVCKKKCNLVFFCNTRFGNELINSNPKGFRYDLVWEKANAVGFLSCKYLPLKRHEMIYIFKIGNDKKTYNPQKTKGIPYKKPSNTPNHNCIYGNVKDEYRENKTGDRYPTSIIKFKREQHTVHKTQKPLGLYEWLIKTYSNEKELVMDFCMGSGTGYIACKNTNRQFIGIEKNKSIFDIAQKRIND